MQSQPFDQLQKGDTLIHRLDPRIKVVLTALGILSTVLLPDGAWIAFSLTLSLILALAYLADIPWGFLFKRSLVILPFTLTALTMAFITPGQPLMFIHLGPWTLTPTDAGVIHFASIIARSLLSVQIAILLTASTPFPDLLHALRHLHLPRMLTGILAFMYRYPFVLNDEAVRLLRARQARSARPPSSTSRPGWIWQGKVTGAMVGQLFLRSLERGERVHQAMLARGYRGHIYTLRPHIITPRDWLFALAGILCLLAIQLLARYPIH